MCLIKDINKFYESPVKFWDIIFGEKDMHSSGEIISYYLYSEQSEKYYGVDILSDTFFSEYKVPNYKFIKGARYNLSLCDMLMWKKRNISTVGRHEVNIRMEVELIDQNDTHLLCHYISHSSRRKLIMKKDFIYYVIPKSYILEIDNIACDKISLRLDESILEHDEYSEKFCEYFIDGIENKNYKNKCFYLAKTDEYLKPLMYAPMLKAVVILAKTSVIFNFLTTEYLYAYYVKLKKFIK